MSERSRDHRRLSPGEEVHGDEVHGADERGAMDQRVPASVSAMGSVSAPTDAAPVRAAARRGWLASLVSLLALPRVSFGAPRGKRHARLVRRDGWVLRDDDR